MQTSTLTTFVIGFFIGVAWRTVQFVPFETSLLVLLLAGGLGLVWRRSSSTASAPYLFLIGVLLLAISLGLLRTEIATWQFGQSDLQQFVGKEVTIIGTVVREPDYREQTVQVYVETEEDLVLVTSDRLQSFSYGDLVEVTGKLERPGTFVTELGRTFDYAAYLQAKGVEYRISFAEVSIIKSGQGNFIIENLLKAKQILIQGMQQVIPEPAVGLAGGLLLGVKSGLGSDIEEDFRRTGIIHIVVLSGYNVMLVVGFILFFFSFVFPLRLRAVAGLIAITAFALIVGLSATVVRASVMAALVLLAGVLGRRYDVLRALLLAGFVMVCLNPYLLLFDIGFQLSFMATLGLVLIVPQFETNVVEGKNNWFGMQTFFFATIATQIAVLPLLIYHIGEVSLVSVLINVLVLPVVSVAMLLSFIAGVLASVSITIASLVGFLAYLSLLYILQIASWGAALPFASIVLPPISEITVLLLYGSMFTLWYFKTHQSTYDELAGWVIEEEIETTDRKPVVKEDTPIFFR